MREPCPKCKTGWFHDSSSVGLSSGFHNEPGTNEIVYGLTCWNCGKWIPRPVKVKQLDISVPCNKPLPDILIIRQELTRAEQRCLDYMLTVKDIIKELLIGGKSWNQINITLGLRPACNSVVALKKWYRKVSEKEVAC